MFDVLAVGELNADLVLSGMHRLPNLGEELFAQKHALLLGSSTAIAACSMACLGLKTAFYGRLGYDAYGQVVAERLGHFGVDCGFVQRSPAYETGLTVSLSCDKDRALVTYVGHTIDGFELSEVGDEVLRETRHLHVGSYFLQGTVQRGAKELLRRAKALGLSTSLDAGWDDTEQFDAGIWETLAYTDVFFPNEEEAMRITQESDPERAAARLAQTVPVAAVKLGRSGAMVVSGGQSHSQGVYEAQRVDTTGAGDNFNAGFLAAWLAGKTLPDCLSWGNAAGSISVTSLGGNSDRLTKAAVEETIRTGRVV